MRFFNRTGPTNPKRHYFIPHRINWNEVISLIEREEYFVLHAPRQTGKTTAIEELIRSLNSEYSTLYINIEPAQAARDNVKEALITILAELRASLRNQLPDNNATIDYIEKLLREPQLITFTVLVDVLEFWAKDNPKPKVLFIDEIDALIGDSLLSVLRQIRRGFGKRPKNFPQSICLIGLRDVRDYRVWSKEAGVYVSAASPFNIKAESLRLPNFSPEEVAALYHQHTQETGQVFEKEAVDFAFHLTQGQPWLVNALAFQAAFVLVEDRSQPITKVTIEKAKETLIKRRDTHLDSLIDKLREPRVRPIIEAIITGETDPGNIQSDDLQYVRDLGLVKLERLDIANPIYREIIPRELNSVATELITQTALPYKRADGSLNASALIQGFVDFYRENSAIWLDKFDYKEAAPHLLMMAFLQRVINGGGTLQREYALGTRRVDILLKWGHQVIVFELKIRHNQASVTEGLKQTASYMDTSAASEGHLIVFDRDPNKAWEEKIFALTEAVNGKTVHVWGL